MDKQVLAGTGVDCCAAVDQQVSTGLRMPTVPFPHLATFQRRLCTTFDAVVLPVSPRPDSTPVECFRDAIAQASEQGGVAVLGWALWIWPRVMAEAQLHAVWRSPSGRLLDVSARRKGEFRILFLPAEPDSGVNAEKPVDNLRFPLHDHPAIHELIRIGEEKHRIRESFPGLDRTSLEALPANRLLNLQIAATVANIKRLENSGDLWR